MLVKATSLKSVLFFVFEEGKSFMYSGFSSVSSLALERMLTLSRKLKMEDKSI